MTKQLGTVWLIGFMAVMTTVAGCLETNHQDRGPNGSCADSQYFTIKWGVDHGPGTLALTCAQIGAMASHVELSTNAAPPDAVLTPSYNLFCQDGAICSDGSPCNMSADTVSGLPVGTAVLQADLIGSDGSVLSTSPGQGTAYAITSCDGWVLPFTFATAL